MSTTTHARRDRDVEGGGLTGHAEAQPSTPGSTSASEPPPNAGTGIGWVNVPWPGTAPRRSRACATASAPSAASLTRSAMSSADAVPV